MPGRKWNLSLQFYIICWISFQKTCSSGLLKDGSYCLLLDIAKSQWVHGVELLGSFINAVQPPVESKRGDFSKEKRARHVHMHFMEDNLQYAIS